MRQLIICILSAGVGFLPTGLAQEFKAGAAVRVITPDPLLPVSGGVGTPTPTTVKKGDLYARAVVFEKGDMRIAIVNIDNLGWPAALGDQSRALITRIPAENVLIGVTHTHSAPDAYAFPDEQGNTGADLEYLDWCVKQVAEAVNEAVENLESASLKIAVGKAEGKIAFNYYAPQLYDPRCGVIQAVETTEEGEGRAIATLVNYAIHPEVLGANQGILSPDMCGPLYERIEDKIGGIALFMNGALGGMVTADNRRDDGTSESTWEECIRIGNLLADEALRIISEAEPQVNPGLYCASQEVTFPVDSEMMRYILQNSPLSLNSNQTNTVSTRLNLVNIGTAQILTIPGEALPNIGYYLKRNMPTKHPFLFGLTNDAFGYILTKEDFNSFERYDYISRTSLGEMTGEIYTEEALNLIRKSPEPTEQ
ncbi:MAG: hypothetical protein AAF632_16195 [Bacteroidota bacterium]